MKYCVWNNKGGGGKTFLTYCLATTYAERHPDKKIVVVDMCPQANVSEMLLGGDGPGEENLHKCYLHGRTVANYIKSRYSPTVLGRSSADFNPQSSVYQPLSVLEQENCKV